MTLAIDRADVDDTDVTALVALHHADMAALSPRESMHALDVSGLRHPDIVVWAARDGGHLVGIVALRRVGGADGEIKSMRVADAYRGTGAGRMLLRHVVDDARARGIHTLWLETGSGDAWTPARTLYASEGFTECEAFDGYAPDPDSTFMTRAV